MIQLNKQLNKTVDIFKNRTESHWLTETRTIHNVICIYGFGLNQFSTDMVETESYFKSILFKCE